MPMHSVADDPAEPIRSGVPGAQTTPDDAARIPPGTDRAKAVEGLIALAEDGAFAALLQPGAEKLIWG
jgi:hypothetical protein